jgi:uncharacterized protein GlcG (DUF336 family)
MLTLSQANTILQAALNEARQRKTAPLCVVVLDRGGAMVAFQREDGAGLLYPDIAFAKAWGSLGLGFGSRKLAELAQAMPTFVGSLTPIAGGRVAPVPGGVLVLDAAGTVIGAVGVAGDKGDPDEACALAGIEGAGLSAATGFPGAR